MTKNSHALSALACAASTLAGGNAWALNVAGLDGRQQTDSVLQLAGNSPPRANSALRPGGRESLAKVANYRAPDAIPDQYIVVFKPGTDSKTVKSTKATATGLGGRIGFTYTTALVGFSAMLPTAALNAMLADPSVEYVEADQRISATTIQSNAPTGLDRTSERPAPPLDTQYTYTQTGSGVHAYVIDTGIRVTHSDFGTRASWSFTAIAPDANDCNGHGTHVAGTIGGTTYGIAKMVQLHAVRVLDCSGSGTESGVIAGVDWVTLNAIHPAVANMSLGAAAVMPALNTAVTNSIASGVVYTVAAGNNFGLDACGFSPALVPSAITVGAMDPGNDTVAAFSNAGPCLDLYAPGVNITSDWNTSDSATNTISGTSMAAPHVAGVVAEWLQNHTMATPSAVWNHLHVNTNNVSTTLSWPAGLLGLPPNSPNELLHYGSLNDGADDGDPHLTTVGGVHYDFQSAGEFVALRDSNGMQIQTRQTPVQTVMNPGVSPYSGLASCVSLNTAVAARVGMKRVTYQPNISGIPDPSGMQLRVDGVLTTLGLQGLTLAPGARVVKAPVGDGIEIDFPDGTVMTALSNYWVSQGKWYLNVKVMGTQANEGVLGAIHPGSWLPALPNGSSLGLRPAALHDRYVDLNETFADAWRVTDATSLFDYAPGTSTQSFTVDAWPLESPPCVLFGSDDVPAQPLDQGTATDLCRPVTGKDANANCVFDVMVTGEPGLAKTYQFSQQITTGATTTRVYDNKDPTPVGAVVTFSATVARSATRGTKAVPKGSVQFSIDGKDVGAPVALDKKGVAMWTTALDKSGVVKAATRYLPARGSVFLPSSSLDELHTVR
jgi:subtilisin family serine protease